MKYDDHKAVLQRLKESQEADKDMRDQAREAHDFVAHRQGQWEPNWWQLAEGRPRYTFDLTTPIVDQITGVLEDTDFSIAVSPSMGGSEEVAETYSGLVRNIENISGAEFIYDNADKEMVIGGISGWRIVQAYTDGDSFDQDLMLEAVPDWKDRVWFGPHQQPDASDAEFAWILSGMTKEEFESRYPDAKPSSVETGREKQSYYHREDLIMVGEFLYLKEVERELHQMSDGSVIDNETLESLGDELAAQGITVERSRKRPKKTVISRLFSANEWLTDERETVFENWIPLIPMYANFAVNESKVTYYGAVEKLIDPQRVYNYSVSREIEEGALAPRAKYAITPTQIAGFEEDWAKMNVSADPYIMYNADPEAPGAPMQQGGAQINPGLRNISEAMRNVIGQTAGMFAANMGDNPGLQSGIAIEALQDRGDTGTNKFERARKIAQRHTGRILVDSIPRVYLPSRQVRLLGEDGTQEFVTVGQEVLDQQTMKPVVLNDLSEGSYQVTCGSGPSFKNRQNETVSTLTELGKVDPSVIEMGGDILAKNVNSPGMKDIGERKRKQLLQAGIIPEDQMTDEELQQLEAMKQQPPPEDPNMVLARAEEQKAQADAMAVQQKAQEAQQEFQLKVEKLRLEQTAQEIEKIRLQIEAAKADVQIKGETAKAAKTIAEAEAQDIENTAVEAGITRLAEVSGGA